MFLNRCGCPFGLVDQLPDCRDEDAAWDLMFEDRRDERIARANRVTVRLVDHDTYCCEYSDLMQSGCIHIAQAVTS